MFAWNVWNSYWMALLLCCNVLHQPVSLFTVNSFQICLNVTVDWQFGFLLHLWLHWLKILTNTLPSSSVIKGIKYIGCDLWLLCSSSLGMNLVSCSFMSLLNADMTKGSSHWDFENRSPGFWGKLQFRNEKLESHFQNMESSAVCQNSKKL